MDQNILDCYTDGACVNGKDKTRPGGWGLYATLSIQCRKREFCPMKMAHCDYGGKDNTTNNNMELRGGLEALKYCSLMKNTQITIYTDSTYFAKGLIGEFPIAKTDMCSKIFPITFPIGGWIKGWIRNVIISPGENVVYDEAKIWGGERKNGKEWWKIYHLIKNLLVSENKNTLRIQWVRGHKDNVGNEIADKLSNLYFS